MTRDPRQSDARPIITLTTDFGTTDFYVPAMKAVLLRACPDAHLIDITHAIPRHDILCGAINLERAIAAFPPGTVHLAVVDPGVGTVRRLLVVQINEQIVVCPDNGLITWAWRRVEEARAFELTWRPQRWSDVFHGRDILAPAAAKLANGEDISQIARPIHDPVLLDVAPAKSLAAGGWVMHIDHFGNAMTNVGEELLSRSGDWRVKVAGVDLGPVRRTYADVATGEPLALIGSSGLLEIALRDGSAADRFGLRVGDRVTVESSPTSRGSQ